MTYQEIAAWMIRHMGPEAEVVAADVERAYRWWRDTPLAMDATPAPMDVGKAALFARRAALEVSIIAHGGLREIEGIRYAL